MRRMVTAVNDSELKHLVQMANQIAANFRFHEDAVERIQDHLTRFWAPSMRQSLAAFVRQGGAGLEAEVVAAVKRMDTQ
jgi:NADPH-dependent 7-cyano-7-deazaguanine reductase QueF